MAVATTLRVSDLARELGIPEAVLVKRAGDNGMLLSTISRLDQAQSDTLRRMFAPARPARAAEAAPVTTAVEGTGRTVVRRRIARADGDGPEAHVEPAPAPVAPPVAAPRPVVRRAAEPADKPAVVVAPPTQTAPVAPEPPAAVEEAPAPAPEREVAVVAAVAAVVETAPAPTPAPPPLPTPPAPPQQPALTDNRPRLRRAKVEDLAPPPELQLRVYETVPEATPVVVPVAEAPVGAPVVQAVESAAVVVHVPEVVAEPAQVPANGNLDLNEIGAALQPTTQLPSNTKVPRLIRTKMPEYLVNIPKATPKPALTDPPPPPPAPDVERGRPIPATERAPSAPVDDRSGGRGRKVIYDRRRDTVGQTAEDRRRGKKRGKGKGMMPVVPVTVARQEKRHLRIEDTITVANLAHQMSVKANEVIKKLFDLGIMATINHALDLDTVELVSADFGFTVENVGFDLDAYLKTPAAEDVSMQPRSPVVTVMGHVDHGKTSLLDAIRKTHTAAREAGGITQHIGAYVAEVTGKGRVVFLDTPGHEAFTAMRARGAKATDVIVLVVAADDGVMPQTIEAINHAKAGAVPIIVAVNKIDKPNADIDRVRRELADQGVVSEEWGGDVTFCEISAKKGTGIDKLLEMLALQSEVMDLKADPSTDARGLVIESRLEKGRGPVATLLVQQGTLKRGQYVVAGSQYCRVRAMLDYMLKPLEEAGPATPVEVIGFDGVTSAGDEFYVVADEKKAKAIVEHRVEKQRERDLLKTSRRTLDSLFEDMAAGETKDLNLIIKADVHGSAEALKAALEKIEHEEVKVRVLHSAVGGVTESDIQLASASKAVIIAFNVRPEAKGKRLADDMGVSIRQYSVIYDAIDDVTLLLEGMLTPIIEENILGHAEVRDTFAVPKLGFIAGCNVTDGVLNRSAKMRLFRGKDQVWEGEVASLRRFKDDVREVSSGYDCGVGLQGFSKVAIGDRLECYELKKIARKLNSPARPARSED